MYPLFCLAGSVQFAIVIVGFAQNVISLFLVQCKASSFTELNAYSYTDASDHIP